MSERDEPSVECQRAIDQFLQEQRRVPEQRQRRQLKVALYIAFFALSIYCVQLSYAGQWPNAWVQIGSLALTVIAWFMLERDRPRLSAWLLVIALQISTGLSALWTGLVDSLAVWFLALPTMAAVCFLPLRDIRRCLVLPAACVLLIYGWHYGGFAVPTTTLANPAERLFSQLQMVIVLVFVVYTTTNINLRLVHETAGHRRIAREETRRAERENSHKTRFLAKMSHELRTPMNGMLGMVQFLESRPLEPAPLKTLGKLRQCAQHVLEHINDALDLTQVDAGHLAQGGAVFRFDEILDRVCELQVTGETRLELKLSEALKLDEAWFMGDTRRVRHLLSTMLGAAVSLANDEKIGLEVSPCPGVKVGTKVCIRIEISHKATDTSVLARVDQSPQEPGSAPQGARVSFQQAQYAARLVPAFRMASLLGGDLEVRRKGPEQVSYIATFSLEPAKAKRHTRPKTFGVTASVAEQGQGLGFGVLVVDDNDINRKVAQHLLRRLGCRVSTASDGQEALEMASEQRFDAILMDLRMPRMDGFESAKAIIANNPKDHPPILALTANAYEDDVNKSLACGMVAHLSKPISLDDLREALLLHVVKQKDAA